MDNGAIIGMLSQFGPMAVIAFLLWRGYQDLTARLFNTLERNSLAMQDLSHAVNEITRSMERLAVVIHSMETRLLIIEEHGARREREHDKIPGQGGGD